MSDSVVIETESVAVFGDISVRIPECLSYCLGRSKLKYVNQASLELSEARSHSVSSTPFPTYCATLTPDDSFEFTSPKPYYSRNRTREITFPKPLTNAFRTCLQKLKLDFGIEYQAYSRIPRIELLELDKNITSILIDTRVYISAFNIVQTSPGILLQSLWRMRNVIDLRILCRGRFVFLPYWGPLTKKLLPSFETLDLDQYRWSSSLVTVDRLWDFSRAKPLRFRNRRVELDPLFKFLVSRSFLCANDMSTMLELYPNFIELA